MQEPTPAVTAQLDEHLTAFGALRTLLPRVDEAAARLIAALESGGKVLTFGNGGSAADALHFAEELIGRYRRDRRPLAAIALVADPTALTCIGNDYGFESIFSRQMQGLARKGDVAVGITTSGNSENVFRALHAAKEAGAVTLLLTGGTGGRCAPMVDHCLIVPSTNTARIQEMHIFIIHCLCEALDRWAAGK